MFQEYDEDDDDKKKQQPHPAPSAGKAALLDQSNQSGSESIEESADEVEEIEDAASASSQGSQDSLGSGSGRFGGLDDKSAQQEQQQRVLNDDAAGDGSGAAGTVGTGKEGPGLAEEEEGLELGEGDTLLRLRLGSASGSTGSLASVASLGGSMAHGGSRSPTTPAGPAASSPMASSVSVSQQPDANTGGGMVFDAGTAFLPVCFTD